MKETIAAVLTAIIGLAVVAVLVSQRSQTAGVFQAAGSSLATLIGAATAPVTGTTGTGGAPMLGNQVGGSSGNWVP